MSGSVNRVHLIGNIGRDPEIRYTQSGTAVCELSIATSEKWKDKSGETQEKTEWHRVVCWNQLAENCSKYLSKGRSCYVEGKLQTRKWTDKEGVDRYTTEIVAQNVVFLGGGGERGEQGQGRESSQGGTRSAGQHRTESYSRGGQRQEAPPADYGGGPGAGDDDAIPFAPMPDIG